MEIPSITIDRDIAAFDIGAEMWGEEQPVFSANMMQDFLDLNKDAPKVKVVIRTDGGSTSEARIIYDMLRNSGKHIITEGFKVNSSGVMIFLAGDERLIAENADFLIHPVWIDPMGLPFMLTGEDLQVYANEVKDEEAKLRNLYMKVIGEDKREEVTTLMEASTNLSNVKAIELGFATGKLESQGVKEENKRAISFNNKMASLVMRNKKSDKQKQIDMSNENTNKIIEAFNKTLELFKPKNAEAEETETKNASTELADGGSMFYDGELAETSAVFSDESMESKMGNDDYTLTDGRVVTVVDGKVTAIAAKADEEENKETENKETVELNKRIDALEATNKELLESQNSMTEMLDKTNTILQNFVPAHDETKKKKVVKSYKEMTNREKMEYNKENKY